MNWTGLMVRELCSLKAHGMTDFDRAWDTARLTVKIPGTREDQAESFAAFFRRMCEREWRGEATADYSGLLEMTLGRETRDARMAGARRVGMRRVA